jgi:hypothetical protein
MQRIRSRGKGVSSSGTFPWRSWLIALGALCVFGAPGGASGAGPSSPSDQFQICPRPNTSDTDRYALCATAQCFFLNGVAYCNCDVMNGSSISIPFEFQGGGTSQNICDLLDDGVNNGFTVSTYSTPETLKKSYADAYSGVGPPLLALYTCPGGSSGAYAQCDGGVCFDSSTGNDFPGVGPIGAGQILCACPITEPRSAGPEWPQGDWFSRFCFPTDANPATGDIIPVGAPQGTPRLLSRLLDGSAPVVNECQVKRGKGPK